MPNYICVTCGTQFAATDAPPAHCPICEDERQYVPSEGQLWTTLDELRSRHHNVVRAEESGLSGIGTEGRFAIGQRALLIQAPGGNVLWDCISLIGDATVAAVEELAASARSRSRIRTIIRRWWSRAFGDAPIYLHAADQEWVMRPDPAIHFWDGHTLELGPGLTLIRCGGHFPGGTVLHRAAGAEGRGVLLSGDIINVVQDRRYVSFMYSYPNLIPLPAQAVRGVVDAVAPFDFDRIYSAWWGTVVQREGKQAVRRSAERYIRAIEG